MIAHRSLQVDGVTVAYREAGNPSLPTLVLLHGFPTSSYHFRNFMVSLEDRFHTIAPDYPGFGMSDAPALETFDYTFDRYAEIIDAMLEQLRIARYALYMHDFGSPVGFRLALAHPDRVTAIVVQNANAYIEGVSELLFKTIAPFWEARTPASEAPLRAFTSMEGTRSHYYAGAGRPEAIAPEGPILDQALLDRPGGIDRALALLANYATNVSQYDAWQRYLKEHRPPALIVWGTGDPFFTVEGARAYLRDLPDAKLELLDAGLFALEEQPAEIAGLVRSLPI